MVTKTFSHKSFYAISADGLFNVFFCYGQTKSSSGFVVNVSQDREILVADTNRLAKHPLELIRSEQPLLPGKTHGG